MTPRTIEEVLFEKIDQQQSKLDALYDLSLDAPLFQLDHPKVLKAKLLFENDNEHEPEKFEHPEWKAAFYGDLSEAHRFHPEIQSSFRGTPAALGKFLQENVISAVINFDSLGVAVLSKTSLVQGNSPGLHQHVLPPWVTYALSPEMWSSFGKWPRFHQRLHTLFENFHLLQGEDFPGYYPLKKEASALEKFGFKGSVVNQSLIFQMNWTFPLTALEKLEKVVSKEL